MSARRLAKIIDQYSHPRGYADGATVQTSYGSGYEGALEDARRAGYLAPGVPNGAIGLSAIGQKAADA